MSVGIFYGSSTGITEEVAQMLEDKIPNSTLVNVADGIDNIQDFDFLILCSPTWGLGDLQDDWMAEIDDLPSLVEKPVALLGTGDCIAYPDTFVDGIRTLYDKCKKAKAKIVGMVPTEGYNFIDSTAVLDGKFLGLPIDHINEPELTEKRIDDWLEKLQKYLK